jgi:hypothetical protein
MEGLGKTVVAISSLRTSLLACEDALDALTALRTDQRTQLIRVRTCYSPHSPSQAQNNARLEKYAHFRRAEANLHARRTRAAMKRRAIAEVSILLVCSTNRTHWSVHCWLDGLFSTSPDGLLSLLILFRTPKS